MSFLISLMTGLGIGSGGLFVLWLVFVKGAGQAEAQGLNLIFFSASILSSTLVNLSKHRIIKEAFLPLVFFGFLFSAVSAVFTPKISSDILSRAFGGFLVLSGVWGLFQSAK